MLSNLCSLHVNDLWFQIGELLQELIIIVKGCFFIDDNNGNTVWEIFGGDLLVFFNKFTKSEKELLPLTISMTFPILITRFQPSFNEDKLVFLENEILKNKRTSRNNSVMVLLFQEILPIYFLLYNNNFILNVIFQRLFLNKIKISGKIKRFIVSLSRNYSLNWRYFLINQNTKLKNSKKIAKNKGKLEKNFASIYKIKNRPNNCFYSGKHSILNFLIWRKFIKNKFRIFLTPHFLLPKFLKINKEDWFFEYSYRNIKYKPLKNRFFQNSATHRTILIKKFYFIRFFYYKFFTNFYKFSHKVKVRWSKLGKKLNGDKFFIEKLTKSILTSHSDKIILNQERQLALIIRNYSFNYLERFRNSGNFSFDIQKTLNKISIVKTKILYKN